MEYISPISSAVMAHEGQSCNVNFDKDLVINSQLVSMKDAGTELWRIDNDGQLWLDGKTVSTDSNTRALLRDYQAGVRTQTLETVALVDDALALADAGLHWNSNLEAGSISEEDFLRRWFALTGGAPVTHEILDFLNGEVAKSAAERGRYNKGFTFIRINNIDGSGQGLSRIAWHRRS